MFLTKLAKIIAYVAMAFGILRITIGFFVASIDDPISRSAAASRYLGSASSGEAIDRGIYLFCFGLILALLARIASASAKRNS